MLGCDGIYDVMSNQQIIDFLSEKLGFTPLGGPVGGVSPQVVAAACDDLLAECLHRGSIDNMSVVCVVLGAPPTPSIPSTR